MKAPRLPFADFSASTDRLYDRPSQGLVILEQRTIRSSRFQECIECGATGTVEQESGLIKVVRSYWFCDDCAAYWQAKS